ncbi:MAG: hypothetical protein LBH82_06050 [Bacteroidales bacterium]|jgi:hypothetical protein|nr:hypothetical protein [Bacteroidales bacterium]
MRNYLLKAGVLSLILAFGFTSCNKEGVYKPKEKISKIHYEYSYEIYQNGELVNQDSHKYLDQIWHWKGKKLTQIENSEDWPSNFIYKGNQLEKIEMGEMTVNFTYKKSLLDKVEAIEDDKTIFSISIDAREDKKITRMICQYYYYYDDRYYPILHQKSNNADKQTLASANRMESIMALVLPTGFSDILAKSAAKKGRKSTEIETRIIELTYDGNNIIEQKITDEDGYNSTYVFTYDKYKNPHYKSFLGAAALSEDGSFIQSENNVLTLSSKDDPEYTVKFEYTYENDFPATQTVRYTYGNEWYQEESIRTIHYEYK